MSDLQLLLLERKRLHGGVRGQSALMHLLEPLCELQAHVQQFRVQALEEVCPGPRRPPARVLGHVCASEVIVQGVHAAPCFARQLLLEVIPIDIVALTPTP